MEAVRSPETLVTTHKTTRRHNQEYNNQNCHRCEYLTSQIHTIFTEFLNYVDIVSNDVERLIRVFSFEWINSAEW
jgi:hypothetical protein